MAIETAKRTIAIVTACMRQDGLPTFTLNQIEASQEEIENGIHYYLAEAQLLEDGLEEPFVHLYPPTEEGPRVAVEGIETEAGRRIVLFTTESITLREANARLLEEGFRGVLRLDEVRHIDRMPVLGTGKTDYKVLRAQIAETI